jgi:hypothetical protein
MPARQKSTMTPAAARTFANEMMKQSGEVHISSTLVEGRKEHTIPKVIGKVSLDLLVFTMVGLITFGLPGFL